MLSADSSLLHQELRQRDQTCEEAHDQLEGHQQVCGGVFILTAREGFKERFLNESSSVLDRGFFLMQVLVFVHV